MSHKLWHSRDIAQANNLHCGINNLSAISALCSVCRVMRNFCKYCNYSTVVYYGIQTISLKKPLIHGVHINASLYGSIHWLIGLVHIISCFCNINDAVSVRDFSPQLIVKCNNFTMMLFFYYKCNYNREGLCSNS